MTEAELRAELIHVMRQMPGPYYAWPTASAEDDGWIEDGDGYYAPGIGQVADALLPVLRPFLATVPTGR